MRGRVAGELWRDHWGRMWGSAWGSGAEPGTQSGRDEELSENSFRRDAEEDRDAGGDVGRGGCGGRCCHAVVAWSPLCRLIARLCRRACCPVQPTKPQQLRSAFQKHRLEVDWGDGT